MKKTTMTGFLRGRMFLLIHCAALLIWQPFSSFGQQSEEDWLTWSPVSEIPDSLGLGGAIAGVHHGVILVAGGSNFLDPVWEGGEKKYHKEIFVLRTNDVGEQTWANGGELPFAVSNGASVSTPYGVFNIGGMNQEGDLDRIVLLKWNSIKQEIETDTLFPRLPQTVSYPSATYLNGSIYVAGGKNEANPGGLNNFWKLDLSVGWSERDKMEWKELPVWPGPGRYGSVLLSQNNGYNHCLYLISGKSHDDYLTDVFEYNPIHGDARSTWIQKSDAPRAAMVAAAATIGQTHLMVFSGSDGHDVDKIMELKDQYSFTRDILAYHTITDTWIKVGELPFGVVATHALHWNDGWLIPGGEIRPGRRTNVVLYGQPDSIAEKSFLHWLDYTVLGFYFLFITLMGTYFSRQKDKGTKGYFLGGGKIPFWVAGLSIMASSVSSIGFMATPSKSFATDWAYFAGSMTMFIVIPIVVFAFIPFYHKLKVVSAYEYLEERFNVIIRLFAAAVYSMFQIAARMSIVLYLPGIALSAITGMNVYMAILLMGVLGTAYTILGGMKAVIWMEVLEGTILISGAMLCILVAVISLDGSPVPYFQEAISNQKFNIGDITDWDYATASLWVVIFGNIFYRLSTYTSDQSIVQRYMVTSDIRKAQKASWTSLGLLFPWAILVFMLGTVLFIFYKANPGMLNPLVNPDGVLPMFISQSMPVGLRGLIIAAIFSAAISSLDGSMHSTSTVIVTDFYKRFFPNSSEQDHLKVAKWLIALFGIFGTGISLIMVTQNHISIWDVFLEFTGLFGGITAGLFFLGIFSTRGNSSGAIAGIIGSIIILVYVKTSTNIHLLLYGAISLISCFVLGYFFSRILPGKSKTMGLTIFSKREVTHIDE